jgi:hypothetical protein
MTFMFLSLDSLWFSHLDVALNIHFETISGVKLFHGCNPGLIKMLGRQPARLKPS